MFAQRKSHRRRKFHQPGGFTLVELLVVIFIIGVLVALLLPAVQAAREAARRVTCRNHLKQFALAAITHEEQQGFYPSGGWGRLWVGDADRGYGAPQPGNWAYSCLPFLEGNAVYDLPKDGKPGRISPQQREGARKLMETPLDVFNCPSRREAIAYPTRLAFAYPNTEVQIAAKLDYAINYGDHRGAQMDSGPLSIADWRDEHCHSATGSPATERCRPPFSPLTGARGYNGVSFAVSEVGVRHVSDGTSNTYLIGERLLDSLVYTTEGDSRTWCTGFTQNTSLSAYLPPLQDRDGVYDLGWRASRFGSAHAAGMHMAFCDGSVRVIEYEIDRMVHMAGGNRHDGTVHGLGQTEIPEPPYERPPRP